MHITGHKIESKTHETNMKQTEKNNKTKKTGVSVNIKLRAGK